MQLLKSLSDWSYLKKSTTEQFVSKQIWRNVFTFEFFWTKIFLKIIKLNLLPPLISSNSTFPQMSPATILLPFRSDVVIMFNISIPYLYCITHNRFVNSSVCRRTPLCATFFPCTKVHSIHGMITLEGTNWHLLLHPSCGNGGFRSAFSA